MEAQAIIKPQVDFKNVNGNVYVLLEICLKALKQAGFKDYAKELKNRVFESEGYQQALLIMSEYCKIKW